MPKSQHAELFNLIEYDGPHVSIPVLDRVFPQGLEAHDPDISRILRAAYEQWDDEKDDPAIHRLWVEHILKEVLKYPTELLATGAAVPAGIEARVAEHGETLRPDYVLVNPNDREGAGKPRLLIRVLPPDQDLEKPEQGSHWKASPDTRMMILCKAANVPLGLLTNGEHWMLVYAPPDDTTGYTSWYAHLWLEEPLTLRAWRSLLGTRRFFGVTDADTLEGMLAESAKNQQEVTDQLGLQVRQAVEILVATLDQIGIENDRTILADVTPEELYEASLTVMMRLVFLFCAEERDLLLLGDPVYDQFYAVSTLSAQLREVADQHGEEILERRCDAWSRLLATFRAVFAGVQHENLRLTAYGGSLFDPDRFPFLEGRPKGSSWRDTSGRPLPVDNRTVLHLMEALQFLQLGGERQRLSFRALGIEQIGHVYEGLLDHTVFRAPLDDIIVSLRGAKGNEPEVAVSELEARQAKGEVALIEFLAKLTGRPNTSLKKALDSDPELEAQQKLRLACGHDEKTFNRVLPFVGLIRDDSFGHPVVIKGGSFYVTQGSERRKTGTHYTPKSLTEPIVQYTLEPLVYEGPAEGWDREKWKLKSAAEILSLKVCDMAMGSGAFLVQTVRYLAERLAEAWENAEKEILNQRMEQMGDDERKSALAVAAENVLSRMSSKHFMEHLQREETESQPPSAAVALSVQITPEGYPSTGAPNEQLIPADPDERMLYARRIVCDRCIYGVDINPLAVEMAKLSLWLVTMGKGRAFTFLNHALKCGDSLLGLWDVEQIHKFHLDASVPVQAGLWGDHLRGIFDNAMAKRRELESFSVVDVRDAEAKARLLAEADRAMEVVRILCDLLIAGAISTADGNSQRRGKMLPDAFDQFRNRIFDRLMEANSRKEIDSAVEAVRALIPEGQALLNAGNPNPKTPRRPFHWPLEYPEIFTPTPSPPSPAPHCGFSAFIGNPPFQGGQKITGVLGTDFRNYCIDAHARGQRGSADLCAYFFLRAGQLLVGPGDEGRGAGVESAVPQRVSPTTRPGVLGLLATNTIAQGDTREVGLEQLVRAGFSIIRGVPSRKWPGTANLEVAHVWMRKGPWHGACCLDDRPVPAITPFLVIPGKVAGKPYRLAANSNLSFKGTEINGMGFVVSKDEAARLTASAPENGEVLFPFLNGIDLNTLSDQSATRAVINFRDWPIEKAQKYSGCMAIVQTRVLPEIQEKTRRSGKPDARAERWWQFRRITRDMYDAIEGFKQVLVIAQTSRTLTPVFVPNVSVFSKTLVVFALRGYDKFALWARSLHFFWALEYGSTMRTDATYVPTDCFETFPFPKGTSVLEGIGETYHGFRQSMMLSRKEGLTALYNRFNAADEHADDIRRLRELHAEMDRAVAEAYGWTDLDLGHDFHQTKQGIRFTVSEPARREILDRLLALNHQRYKEEVAQGLHDKGSKTKGKAARKKSKADQEELF